MMKTVPALYQFWERSLTESRFSLYGTVDAVMHVDRISIVTEEDIEYKDGAGGTGEFDVLLSTLMMAWLSEFT